MLKRKTWWLHNGSNRNYKHSEFWFSIRSKYIQLPSRRVLFASSKWFCYDKQRICMSGVSRDRDLSRRWWNKWKSIRSL
jgi:hypothetical protein